MMTPRTDTLNATPLANEHIVASMVGQLIALCSRVPHWPIAFLARFSIAAVFWNSGQTKIQGFAIDLIHGEFTLG